MWFFSKPNKCDDNDIANSTNYTNPKRDVGALRTHIFDTLEDQTLEVRSGKTLSSILELIKQKQIQQDVIVQTVQINNKKSVTQTKNENCSSDIIENSSKIDIFLNFIPVFQNNLQSLSTKITQLTDILSTQKINEDMLRAEMAKTNTSLCHVKNYVNKLNCKLSSYIGQLSELKKKPSEEQILSKPVNNDTIKGKENKKSKKVKSSKKGKVSNKKKTSKKQKTDLNKAKSENQKIKSENSEIRSAEMNKSINEIEEKRKNESYTNDSCINLNNEQNKTNSSSIMVDYCSKVDSILACIKTTEEIERSKILDCLSKLEYKINSINMNDSKIETLICNLEKIISNLITNEQQNKFNTKRKACQGHHEQKVEGSECFQNQSQDSFICNPQVSNASSIQTNNARCLNKICVCKYMEHKNCTHNIDPLHINKIENSSKPSSCESNIKSTSIATKPTVQSECSKKTENSRNDVSQIFPMLSDIKVKSNESICSRKLYLNTNANYTNTKFKSKCDKSFCDYLLNQPTPEWIKKSKQDEKNKTRQNNCQQTTSSHTSSVIHVYNVEKLVDGCLNDTVYRFTAMGSTQDTDINNKNINKSCSDKFSESTNNSQETNI